jgi:hypothetical protein
MLFTLLIGFSVLYESCKKDQKGDYQLNGKWICEHHKEYQGELEFKSESFNLYIIYLFQDSISGTIEESGSYSYTSTYHEPDNLFSSGYYSGRITFNSNDRTFSIAYSYGQSDSFAFVNYKIDPKITLGTMWWGRN